MWNYSAKLAVTDSDAHAVVEVPGFVFCTLLGHTHAAAAVGIPEVRVSIHRRAGLLWTNFAFASLLVELL